MSMPRRAFLRVGGAGVLTLPQLLSAKERTHAPAKAVIFLHQWGGPGQLETLDPKPDAPENVRGWFGAAKTNVPGIILGEKLPKLAAMADQFALVRSLHHTMANHNSAGYYSLTGAAPASDDQRLRDSPELFPAYGSIVSKFAPAAKGVPTFVSFPHTISDGSVTPGQQASFLGKGHNPLFVGEDPNAATFQLPELSLPQGLTPARLEDRTKILGLIDDQAKLLEQSATARGVDASYRKAVEMLTTPKFRAAFDLTQEKPATREGYGRTTYGQSCLLARRLVEAGAKFVNVYFARSIGGTGQGWDYHGFKGEDTQARLRELLPITDQTLPMLLTDLKQRGLLESTLVVWVGEFGRTPKVNGMGGRDHWPKCYSALVAGGGTKGGFVYGKSDKSAAYPVQNLARPEDLSATMFHALGIDPESEVRDAQNRPHPASRGKAITELFA